MRVIPLILALFISLYASSAFALSDKKIFDAHCKPADNVNWVVGKEYCLRILTGRDDRVREERPTLIVYIGGDRGDRRDVQSYLRKVRTLKAPGVVPILLIRPGYFDHEGNRSTGARGRSSSDYYTPRRVGEIAAAVQNLKTFYGAGKTILIGQSGGAVISGVIIGKHPGVADGVILMSCPCDLLGWYAVRAWETNDLTSLSPQNYVGRVPVTIHVIAITGEYDNWTPRHTVEPYIEGLQKRGVNAEFHVALGAKHTTVLLSKEFKDAVRKLLNE